VERRHFPHHGLLELHADQINFRDADVLAS
jgi:hypothetical protein